MIERKQVGTKAWNIRVLRIARSLLVPLAVALPPFFWVRDATERASLSTIGRDQGIFQYVAWALTQGARDYRDVRDVNGPLTHLVHLVFLYLGGGDEHRFRILDLFVTGLTFAFVGACLPGIGRRIARTGALPRAPSLWERLAWAFAGWVVLSGQYLLYLYWDLAQRESFANWFLVVSVGLQLVAQSRFRDDRPAPVQERRRLALWVAVGAFGVVPWFGKPTYVLFTAAQLLVLFFDRDAPLPLKKRLVALALGSALGALPLVLFLLRYADTAAYLRISLVDVPALYRFIWPRSAVEILSRQGFLVPTAFAFATTAALVGLIWVRELPRRALLVALLPMCGLGNAILQKKGFPYHFHALTAGLYLEWLLIVAWLWERNHLAPSRASIARFVPFVAAGALSLRVAGEMQFSPHITNIWILAKAATKERRDGREYLVYFHDADFFPWDMRRTARYLERHTKPDDRVQLYGMDPYVLFLARRLSATPYIYAYDLNVRAALDGGWSLWPNAEQAARIRAIRDAHEDDLLRRVQANPPAAFVFVDKSPLITYPDAWEDFRVHSAKTSAWVLAHYRRTANFKSHHVWLRTDLAAGLAEYTSPAEETGDEAEP